MTKVTIVCGGQLGSECKGHVCAILHAERRGAVGVRVGGSQAGHTVYDDEGRKWPLRHVPVAAVIDDTAGLVIGAGSEIDLGVLYKEIEQLEAAGYGVKERLMVDHEATVIEDRHKDAERGLENGSTKKGVGAARADRALRKARRIRDLNPTDLNIVDTKTWLLESRDFEEVIIEGVQGYGLGSHAGFYPHCTSGDCRAIDFMAAAGLPPQEAEVWVVARPYPIRIAGDSGPLEGETSWSGLGLEPEITTVTKKVRRVGTWNGPMVREAVRVNGGERVKLALMQADYKFDFLKGRSGIWEYDAGTWDLDPVSNWLDDVRAEVGAKVALMGTGPQTHYRVQEYVESVKPERVSNE